VNDVRSQHMLPALALAIALASPSLASADHGEGPHHGALVTTGAAQSSELPKLMESRGTLRERGSRTSAAASDSLPLLLLSDFGPMGAKQRLQEAFRSHEARAQRLYGLASR